MLIEIRAKAKRTRLAKRLTGAPFISLCIFVAHFGIAVLSFHSRRTVVSTNRRVRKGVHSVQFGRRVHADCNEARPGIGKGTGHGGRQFSARRRNIQAHPRNVHERAVGRPEAGIPRGAGRADARPGARVSVREAAAANRNVFNSKQKSCK